MRMMRMKHADLWPTNYTLGMWVWLLHRITGIILAVYGLAHLVVVSLATIGSKGKTFDDVMSFFHEPVILALEMVLIAAIFFHVLNGFRILLFDLGIGVRVQKQIFVGLMMIGAVLYSLAVWAIMPAFS